MIPKTILETSPFGRQIAEIHPNGSCTLDAKNENWFFTPIDENDEEEVYWKGNTVVISSYDVHGGNHFLKKCYTVNSLISTVLYTNFYLKENCDDSTKCLCVLEKEFLNVFTVSGETFVASLPFKIRKIWAIHNGVCLEREPSNTETDESKKGMPTLFSLTHPLDQFKPIVYRYQDSRKPMYFTDSMQSIVFTYPKQSLIMTYDSVIGMHSIWTERKAVEQDYPEILNQLDCLPKFLSFAQSPISQVKDQSRMSVSPMRNKHHSCPPIPLHANKRSSPNSSPQLFSPSIQSNILQYSPQFLNRHHSSTGQNLTLSPIEFPPFNLSSPIMSRISCDESSHEDDLEPLTPDVCLKQVWQEHGYMIRHGLKGKAAKGFTTQDFFGNIYLGYIIKDLGKLRLLIVQTVDKNLKFEKVFEMDCYDAGGMEYSDLFAVLDKSYNVHLFTGKQKVVTLQVAELNLEKSSPLPSLKYFTGSSFAISTSDERLQRVEIPVLCRTLLVQNCIEFLKEILTPNEYNLVYAKYYVMFHDFDTATPVCHSDWDRFIFATFKLLGFPESSVKSLKGTVSSPAPPEAKKPKKSDSLTGEEDWEFLLSCRPNGLQNVDYSHSAPKYCIEVKLRNQALLYPHIIAIFLAWHQMYEELKLCLDEQPHLLEFAKFLHYLANVLQAVSYVSLYEADFPEFKKSKDTVYKLVGDYPAIEGEKHKLGEDCSIYNIICESILHKNKIHSFNGSQKIYTSVVLNVFSQILDYIDATSSDFDQLISALNLERKSSLVENIISTMLTKDFSREDMEKLPIGYKLPIKEILSHYNAVNDVTMSLPTAIFLGRDDIVALRSENAMKMDKDVAAVKNDNEDKDGMTFDTEIFQFRFNQDLRVNEVKKVLNSSVPVEISLVQKFDVNDHAFAKEEEARLLVISNRTMSLPIARGMFTLGTSKAVKSEVVSIPELDLTGRSTTNNKIVLLAQTDTSSSRTLWPSFHNGVAAGLKIGLVSSQIETTWILLNKIKSAESQADHAGFLLALGLAGHLKCLPKVQLYDYFYKGNELTTVALLLGITAAQIGSKNPDVHVMLSIHLDSLLPQTALELSIPQSSQIAAIISVGLLFFNSVDSHLVKVLLFEIGRQPGPDMENSCDQESHALAAGFSLGMMMIGQGKGGLVIGDVNVETILYHYLNGGQRKENILSIHEKLQAPSCQIQEGDLVNTNVTAPAAIIALALIYLKTNISVIADWLDVQLTNENVMDLLKPDHVLLRILARNLIMWDDLIPSKEWIKWYIPSFDSLLKAWDSSPTNPTYNIHYIISVLAGCFLALGIKFAGSHNSAAFTMMFPWLKVILNIKASAVAEELGAKVILEQCLDTVLISISLVMAGSGNLKVFRFARKLHKRCSSDVSYGNHMAIHMAIGFLFLGGGSYTLKTDNLAIASLLCSVYPNWPIASIDNRFHLQALRHLYVLACEPRLFITRDADSKQICYTPVEVTLKESESYPEKTMKMLSPCFISELKYIKQIKIVGPRYWPIIFKLKNNSITLKHIKNVFVKKKAQYLSYSEDPKGKRNLLASTFTNQSDKFQLIKSFNSSSYVSLCGEHITASNSEQFEKKGHADFFSNILYECVTKEKLDVYENYLTIEKIVSDAENGVFSIHGVQQLNFLYLYYAVIHPKLVQHGVVNKKPLINQLYLTKTRLRLQSMVEKYQRHDFVDSRCPLNTEVVETIINSFKSFGT